MSLTRVTTKEGEVYFIDPNTGQRVEVDQKYTRTKPTTTTLRFNTLLSLGQFVSVVGWIIFFVGVIAVVAGIASITSNQILGSVAVVGGIISLINGILVAAIGQSISCFVSIEHNTYETNKLLKAMQQVQVQK